MRKIEITVPRDALHYVVERLSSIEKISEVTVIGSESVNTRAKDEDSKSSNSARIEILLENNDVDKALQLLLGDNKVGYGRINVMPVERTLELGSKEGYRIKLALSVFIKAPRKRIFALVTNYENLPHELPNYFKTINVRNMEDNVCVLEEEVNFEGQFVKQITRHTVYPPGIHEVEILSGEAEGSRITETYTEVTDGTQVMVVGDFRLKSPLSHVLGFFAKGRLEKSIRNLMNEMAKIAETRYGKDLEKKLAE
ncbi:MAG: SRPBCC family protein [Nitrososphaerales archaeon]